MTTPKPPPGPRPLDPAEIAKLDAETALAAAQAREATAKANRAELELVKVIEDEQSRINSDAHHRLYQFNGPVATASVGLCMAALNTWTRINPTCDIEIIFNSPGGSVIDGMALFDLIANLSKRGGGTHQITVGTRGYAASMAGILLQAGDHRWIGKQSYLMIHEISAGTSGKIGDMKDDVKWYEKISARVVDIFVERSQGKISKSKFITSWTRTDWWMPSDEALKFGFVDEIR